MTRPEGGVAPEEIKFQFSRQFGAHMPFATAAAAGEVVLSMNVAER